MSTPTGPEKVEPEFSASSGTIETRPSNHTPERWKASKQIKMILACLSLVSLVVAIDATILVSALPVSFFFFSQLLNDMVSSWLTSSRLLPSPLGAVRTRLSGLAPHICSQARLFNRYYQPYRKSLDVKRFSWCPYYYSLSAP
jgi:hypothetical protein